MKNIVKKATVLLASATMMVTVGCTDTFEEVNTNPYAFNDVPPTNILANILRGTASEFGGEIDAFGTWAGYIVKIQYPDYMDGAKPDNNGYGNKWYQCYYGNTQLSLIIGKTSETAKLSYVARIWQLYLFQYLVDAWGDVPYSEAFKGAEGNVTPKYDKQEDIYPDLLARLKAIADEMAVHKGDGEIGVGDFLYEGDIDKWQRFCNSLRLRIAMRISGVSPALAKSTIEEICGNPSKYPFIDSNNSSAIFWWQGSKPYNEPWYDNSVSRDDFGVFDIFINHLKKNNDPRLPILAEKNNKGEYVGYVNGGETVSTLQSISHIGNKYRKDQAGFTPFYKACESYFIMAEAAMLGWNVGMTAQAAYEKGVMLSMEDNDVAEADAKAYLANAGKWDNQKQTIWNEMWIGLFKEQHEAWCLHRRTGTPVDFYVSIISAFGDKHNSCQFRAPYPDNEYRTNKAQLDLVLPGIVDYCWGKQLWWDQRKNVK